MRKAVLALMDSEKGYALRFMELVNRRKTSPYDVYAFTEFAALADFIEKRGAEILLIAEKDLAEEVLKWPIELLAVLTEKPVREDEGGYAAMMMAEGSSYYGENTAEAQLSNLPRITKYQAASGILHDLTSLRAQSDPMVGKLSTGEDGMVLKRGMKTIGIFSPVGRSMKTSLAATFAQCLARRKATLLLSFDACTGFGGLLHENYERNMSDALYYIRQKEPHVIRKILPMVKELGQAHYLPPFADAQELYSMTAEEWRLFLEEIRTDSVYEALVLDLGEIPLIHPSILEECDRIYMPITMDAQAQAKMKEFEALLKREAMEPIGAKIRRLKLQDVSLPESMDRWYERLPYSGLGKIVEECIAVDRL